MSDYHSVYTPRVAVEPVREFILGESVALVHDIVEAPLPPPYERCDLLYADLPWRQGLTGYDDRAGVAGRTYRVFLDAVAGIVRTANRPTVLITGRHALSWLPKPTGVMDVTMPVANGQTGVVLTYSCAFDPEWLAGPTLEDVLGRLAQVYAQVGDFCCGYGQSARTFLRAGKRFVASDYNAECIGYIAAHAREWLP